MKKLLTIFTFILCAFASLTIAKEKAEWTHVESENYEKNLTLVAKFEADGKIERGTAIGAKSFSKGLVSQLA